MLRGRVDTYLYKHIYIYIYIAWCCWKSCINHIFTLYLYYACYCMFTISTSRNSWASMEPLSASHAFRRYVGAASISCREADPNAMTLGLCLDIEMQRWQCIYLLCIYLSFVPVYTGNLVQTSQPPYITAFELHSDKFQPLGFPLQNGPRKIWIPSLDRSR